jgi:opacity protein-like surface antigen
MYMRLFLLILTLAATSFAAGPLIIGGRGGTSLTDSTGSAFDVVRSNMLGNNLAVGPTIGVRLPLGFSVEGDALYNRRSLGLGLSALSALGYHADWWEFPVMAKFTPGSGAIAPVLGAGVTVQHINNFGDVPSYLFTGSTQSNSVGFIAGAGVRFRVGAVSVTPEMRYTRWTNRGFTQSLVDTITGGRNQAQLLVGVTF